MINDNTGLMNVINEYMIIIKIEVVYVQCCLVFT